ncbi:dioxygenase, partial [Actinomadura adrarensis]
MSDLRGAVLTDAVVAGFAETPDTRLREILGTVVRHLHAAVQECSITVAEWEYAIGYLTRVGHTCDDVRQEFVLLSDVLGISSLVETVSQGTAAGATEATVLGPFHTIASPARSSGDSLYPVIPDDQACVVRGRVLDTSGRPITGASVDVWQANAEGFYDVQEPGKQRHGDGRGLFTTGEDGGFWFRTEVPAPYPIP